MTNDEADDIVEAWHECEYPDDWELSDVFIRNHGWTLEQFNKWAETAEIPNV